LAIADSSPLRTSVENALAREFEIGERRRNLLAANELGQKIELLRADAQHAHDRFGFGVAQDARGCLLGHGD